MNISLVNVQVWGRSQKDVVESVRQEFGRFYRGEQRALKKHLGFRPEEHAAMVAYRERVRGWVSDLRGEASLPPEAATLVGPALNGWVGVYDAAMDGQNGKLNEAAARRLSEELQTTALTLMVTEGRTFLYVLGQGGVTTDWFLQGHDEPSPLPSEAHAYALARAIDRPDLATPLTGVLERLTGLEALAGVAQTLGILNAALGYRLLALAGPQAAEEWGGFAAITDGDYGL